MLGRKSNTQEAKIIMCCNPAHYQGQTREESTAAPANPGNSAPQPAESTSEAERPDPYQGLPAWVKRIGEPPLR